MCLVIAVSVLGNTRHRSSESPGGGAKRQGAHRPVPSAERVAPMLVTVTTELSTVLGTGWGKACSRNRHPQPAGERNDKGTNEDCFVTPSLLPEMVLDLPHCQKRTASHLCLKSETLWAKPSNTSLGVFRAHSHRLPVLATSVPQVHICAVGNEQFHEPEGKSVGGAGPGAARGRDPHPAL